MTAAAKCGKAERSMFVYKTRALKFAERDRLPPVRNSVALGAAHFLGGHHSTIRPEQNEQPPFADSGKIAKS